MSTIVEVARRASVSIATVSNVIRGTKPVSPELRERVRAAIRELDYYPNAIARGLKVKQTRMLGMVLPDITNPFFPGIIRGAEDSAFVRREVGRRHHDTGRRPVSPAGNRQGGDKESVA